MQKTSLGQNINDFLSLFRVEEESIEFENNILYSTD